jgi:hypothetical protein
MQADGEDIGKFLDHKITPLRLSPKNRVIKDTIKSENAPENWSLLFNRLQFEDFA